MTYGRFQRLVGQLPAESAYVRVLTGPQMSLTDRLLAAVVNDVRLLQSWYHAAHFKPPHPKPTFIRFDTESPRGGERLSRDEMRERLNDPRWRDVTDDPTVV